MMSNAISQERQSIAKNLRYLASCYTPEGGLERFRATLEDELFTGPGHVKYTEIFSRLADIIDLTCKLKIQDGHACCGNCGHRLAGEYEDEDEEDHWCFRPYCPDCGARVMNDDS